MRFSVRRSIITERHDWYNNWHYRWVHRAVNQNSLNVEGEMIVYRSPNLIGKIRIAKTPYPIHMVSLMPIKLATKVLNIMRWKRKHKKWLKSEHGEG